MNDIDHYPNALVGYERFEFQDGPWERPVFRKGSGPAVIIIHEMPGLHPLVVRFADRVVAAGMTVYLPSLFGDPGREVSIGYLLGTMAKTLCVRREFAAWATDRSSPIVDWLRALARSAHHDCGGRGVGVVGMCFTGNFAMAMMTEPAVVAPVLSQPSLPLGNGAKAKAALGLAADEIACARQRFADEGLSAIGLRFRGDPLVPDTRWETYKTTFGDAFEAIDIPDEASRPVPGMKHPHSVLTLNLRDDDPEGPTRKAEERVIAFFGERTGFGEKFGAA
jgi:dienelactone hydrolase